MTCQQEATCGKVQCRGCGVKIATPDDAHDQATRPMRSEDWLGILAALKVGPFKVPDDRLIAKVEARYRAALKGRCLP